MITSVNTNDIKIIALKNKNVSNDTSINSMIPKTLYVLDVRNDGNFNTQTIESFLMYHSDYKINHLKYTEEEFKNLPDVVNIIKQEMICRTELDINNVIERYRYFITYQNGGICCTPRCYFLKRIDNSILNLDTFISCVYDNRWDKPVIDTCLFGCKKGTTKALADNYLYPPINSNITDYDGYRYLFDENKLKLKDISLNGLCQSLILKF